MLFYQAGAYLPLCHGMDVQRDFQMLMISHQSHLPNHGLYLNKQDISSHHSQQARLHTPLSTGQAISCKSVFNTSVCSTGCVNYTPCAVFVVYNMTSQIHTRIDETSLQSLDIQKCASDASIVSRGSQ